MLTKKQIQKSIDLHDFKAKTKDLIAMLVMNRMRGNTLEVIAEHSGLSKSRIANLERLFISGLDNEGLKVKYQKACKKGKKGRMKILV